MTTFLTIVIFGLRGLSSTQRTKTEFFRTQEHVLDSQLHKKLTSRRWGGRGRKFKSCHSDQLNEQRKLLVFLCFIKLLGHFEATFKMPCFYALLRSFFEVCYAICYADVCDTLFLYTLRVARLIIG